MVASRNGVVAWRRASDADDPVATVLGSDHARPERAADRLHMRHLRCFGDVAIGAQTLREQPALVQIPREPGEPPAPELYRFRERLGLSPQPRVIVYSLYGRLSLDMPVFNTPGVGVIVVGTEWGAAAMAARGAADKGIAFVVDRVLEPAGLLAAHRRLTAGFGVRYLACEGGETILRALHGAGVLDEVFVTMTDVEIDRSAHEGVLTIFDFEAEGAALIAEGRTSPASSWVFRRWRFNSR
jgi:riboflavin biosynthesis pyrimidine reductase